MKHSERFTNAVTKLYNAFHSNVLSSMNCQRCAVGSICNNNASWAEHIRTNVNSTAKPPYIRGREIEGSNNVIENTGYSTQELAEIEIIFMTHALFNAKKENKESQFKGLCAVIEYLCELEGIPNIMDYTKLFETENAAPKYELTTAF